MTRAAIAIAIATTLTSGPFGAHAATVGVAAHPHTCPHAYPPDLAAAHLEGDMRLSFTVTPGGEVEDIQVAETSGHPEFDRAAIDCAARWRYRNPSATGVPWEAKVIFRLVAPHIDVEHFVLPPHPIETIVALP